MLRMVILLVSKKMWKLYIHTSPNGKKYIGITSQLPKKRWANGKGYNNNKYFTRAINKYGWNNFSHEIIYDNMTSEEAKNKEKELIEKYDTTNSDKGYNLTRGGDGTTGHKVSEKTRKILSEKCKMYGTIKIIRLDDLKIYDSISIAASENNCDVGALVKVCKGELLSCKNYQWMYYDDYLQKVKNNNKIILSVINKNRKIICLNNMKIYIGTSVITSELGIGKSCILEVCRGEKDNTSNFVFQYYDDYLRNPKNIQDCELNFKNDYRVIDLYSKVVYKSISTANKITKISRDVIKNICVGKIYDFKNYKFMYYRDYIKNVDKNNLIINKNNRKVIHLEDCTTYNSAKEASENTEYNEFSIIDVCNHRIKTTNKSHWMFYDEYIQNNVGG